MCYDIIFKGNIPDCFREKARLVVMERMAGAPCVRSRKWKIIDRLKKRRVFSFPLNSNYRVLQLPGGHFEVLPHELYQKRVNKGRVSMKN